MEALAAAAERERIARELHDSLAQVLGYIRVKGLVALDALKAGDRAGVEAALEEVSRATGEAYADVREAILGLRTRTGPGRDFLSALGDYIQWCRQQSGMSVDLIVGQGLERLRLAPGTEAQLLRIIQEALTNARKHSGASQVTVELQPVTRPSGLYLAATVRDNGRGFDPDEASRPGHFGLYTMRERAQAEGGTLKIVTAPGAGTAVLAEMPAEVTDLAGLGQEL
jgi:signal transduction histidine kinase